MDLCECQTMFTPECNRHFWELARADFLTQKIQTELAGKSPAILLDFGCGDGFLLRRIAQKLPEWNFYAVDSELSPASAAELEAKLPKRLRVFSSLPEDLSGVSAVTMFDVLEHLEDDNAFLDRLTKKLPDGTLLFITVPAQKNLFSLHDRKLRHYRRYDREDLLRMLKEKSLKIHECRELFVPLGLLRKLEIQVHGALWNNVGRGAIRPKVLNEFFRRILLACCLGERFLPLKGLSLEVICQVSH